jgi:hypothetical protein
MTGSGSWFMITKYDWCSSRTSKLNAVAWKKHGRWLALSAFSLTLSFCGLQPCQLLLPAGAPIIQYPRMSLCSLLQGDGQSFGSFCHCYDNALHIPHTQVRVVGGHLRQKGFLKPCLSATKLMHRQMPSQIFNFSGFNRSETCLPYREVRQLLFPALCLHHWQHALF